MAVRLIRPESDLARGRHLPLRPSIEVRHNICRIIIPNSELFTNSVTVNTAFPRRRWQYDIGIGYGDDVERAREIILRVLNESQDVAPDPKADVILIDFAESSANLRGAGGLEMVMLHHRVVSCAP